MRSSKLTTMMMLALLNRLAGSPDAGTGFAAGLIEKEYCLCRLFSVLAMRCGVVSGSKVDPGCVVEEIRHRCSAQNRE